MNDEDYGHYVLIENISFLRKRYTNSNNGKLSYANSLFCKICFEHFRENTLGTHENISGKKSHTIVFSSSDESIHYSNHEYNFKRIFTGYADFESVLEETNTETKCPKCVFSKTITKKNGSFSHSHTVPLKQASSY